jgi:small subunit ribosomal protein S16
MSVVIRLRRAGSRKRPFYHMVVADSRMRRDGRFIEMLGYYNPMNKPETVEFSEERVNEWIQKGAKPSETVDRLIKRKLTGAESISQKERKRSRAAAKKKGAEESTATATETVAVAPAEAAAATATAEAAPAESAGEETPAAATEPESSSEEGGTSSDETAPSAAE